MQHDMASDQTQFAPPSPSPQTRPTRPPRPTSAQGIPPLPRNPQSQSQESWDEEEEELPQAQSTTAQRPPRRPTGTGRTSSTKSQHHTQHQQRPQQEEEEELPQAQSTTAQRPPRRPTGTGRTGSTKSQHHTQHQQRPQQEQESPPGGRATSLGNGAVKWEFRGQTVYVRDATKHPPGASYTVAVIIGLACVFAIFWQMFTTFSAFSTIVFHGRIWLSLPPAGQDVGRNVVYVVVSLLAVGFQAPLLIFAFKIDKRFAAERHKILSISAKVGAIWEGFKEVVAANLLLSIWSLIAILADTMGDVAFVSTLTDSPFFLFFYATSLYGLSTIGLSECLQILWDGMVTSEWLRHVRAANDYATMKMAEMRQRGGMK